MHGETICTDNRLHVFMKSVILYTHLSVTIEVVNECGNMLYYKALPDCVHTNSKTANFWVPCEAAYLLIQYSFYLVIVWGSQWTIPSSRSCVNYKNTVEATNHQFKAHTAPSDLAPCYYIGSKIIKHLLSC